MKMNFPAIFLAIATTALFSGCVRTLDGRAHVAVPVGRDSMTGRYERPVQDCFDAAKRVLTANGRLTAEDTVNHTLQAKVNESTAYVRVDIIDPARPLSQVSVQVRSPGGVTDLSLAHELEKEVALQLVR